MSIERRVFDLTGALPGRRIVVEASAGTGKTYAISALVVRYVAEEGVGIDQLLVVTFTRAAASELRDRTRAKLRLAADHLAGDPLPPHDPWMTVLTGPVAGRADAEVRAQRLARLRRAVNRFDEATISTIHGFGQQALAQLGVRSGVEPNAELIERDDELIAEVCRDMLVGRLADDPFVLSPAVAGGDLMPPAAVERNLAQAVAALITNAGAGSEPPAGGEGLAGEWATFVAAATAEVGRRRRARHQMSYDQLIGDLHRALAEPGAGERLAAQLAERFPLVLVDEFQDTDRLQWEVFDRAFGAGRLVIVGDPKQAIYRFRGADLPAYLEAVRGSDTASLATNFRSDRRLLHAVEVLFGGAELGHSAVRFAPVSPAPHAQDSGLVDGASAALHVRVVTGDASAAPARDTLKVPAVRRAILADLASRAGELLAGGRIQTAGGDEGARPLRPSDIAVLVPSQRLAGMVSAELHRWAIPSVRSRTGSVFESDAAEQWRLLLAGLVAPTDVRAVGAAAIGWFFGYQPAAVLGDVDGAGSVAAGGGETVAAVSQRLAELAELTRARGVAALYEGLRRATLLDQVLGAADGDRNLTDVDHIGELLVARTHGDASDPRRVQQLLDELVSEQSFGDAAMRRIESDADAVTVTTIHSAKGLEYPVVLIPFPFVAPRNDRPYAFTRGTRRVVDVASWVSWVGPGGDGAEGVTLEERRGLAARDVNGDQLRLLYVAVTRARNRVEMWWAPTAGAVRSAFGRILLDRAGAGPVANALGEHVKATAAQVRSQIDTLAAASGGTIAVHEVSATEPVPPIARAAAVTDSALALPPLGARHSLFDPAWRSWSFTAMARAIAERHVAAGEVATAEAASAEGCWPSDDSPATGGVDEPEATEAPLPIGVLKGAGVPSDPPGGHGTLGSDLALADVAGGTTFGTMVHHVLEQVDFADPDLASTLEREVASAVRRAGLAVDATLVARGLETAITSPLGALFGGRALRDLAAADRLTEVAFDLALGDDAAPPIAAAELGRAMVATLPAGHPLAVYARALADDLAGVSLRGWLTGSIDAVFRVPADGGGHRYVVVDYKTNRLHAPGDPAPLDAYRSERLAAAMAHSHYPLQALLYSVALHRYLALRLGAGYDPHVHLGGTAYLFVRGMVGDAAAGVFSWRPPVALVTAADALLANASGAGG